MRPDTSSLRTLGASSVALASVVLSWIASAAGRVATRLWRLLAAFRRATRSAARTARTRARRVLAGPVRRALTGPVRTAVLGRRPDVSLLAVLLAPVLALGAAWWVGTTVGYGTLEAWVHGTWDGTGPSLVVFLAVALLVALGAISAAINSGLLPTTVLVAAPVFGASVTRYGTEVAYSWGTRVVSLPEAVGTATVLAFGFGVPIAVCGFLFGTAARRVVRVFTRGSGPSSSPEGA